MPLVAGVDCSTTATKVEVRDLDTGALVGSGRAPHPGTDPPRSEVEPARWWTALVDAFRAATEACDPQAVTAMAVGAQQHGLVALDGTGAPVHPAKLWNDTESAPQAERLRARLGPAAWAEACGSVPVASFTITKLAWLFESHAAAAARVAHLLLPHDWLTWRLTDRQVTDRGDASGTGYWSPTEERWRADLLALVDAERDWSPALPEVLGPIDAAGTLTPASAAELGCRVETLVAPGTGDNMAAALGLGIGPGDLVVSLGTSGTVYTVAEHPVTDPTGAVAGFADATGRHLPLVCTLNATRVFDATARWLDVDLASLDQLALAADPGAGGVVLVPYLDGERTPDVPGSTGLLTGLRADTTRADLARAAVEGVGHGLADAVDALTAAGVAGGPGPVRLVGGGARSLAVRHVLADLLDRPVAVPTLPEAAATGACVQAAAVAAGSSPEEVAAAWSIGALDLTAGPATEPSAAGAADRRAAYAWARGAATTMADRR